MLKRISLAGFRSCWDVTLDDLGFVTALIGRNSAGKTNLLRGIQWVGRLATSPSVPKVGNVRAAFQEPSRWSYRLEADLDVELGDVLYRYELKLDWPAENGEPGHSRGPHRTESLTTWQEGSESGTVSPSPVFRREAETVASPHLTTPLSIGSDIPALFALAAILPGQSALVRQIGPLRKFLAGIKYYPFAEPSDGSQSQTDLFVFHKDYEAWLARPRSKRQQDVPMNILHLFLHHKDVFEELNRLLGPDGLGLINSVRVANLAMLNPAGPDSPPPDVWFIRFDVPGGAPRVPPGLPFSQLSQGTRRLVRLVLAMLAESASVMLIEHPEDSIHKGLLPKVIGLLRGGYSSAQVILSTHSDTVMNALEPEEVRLVTMEGNETKVRPLAPRELEVCGKFVGTDDGLTLADFVRSVVED